MPLAFPSSHSKCLTCRLAVLSHRTLHASKASTERAFAWTTSGLWSLEVGAGSPIVFFSTGCGEPSLTALMFAYLKGDIPFTDSLFSCHYTPFIICSTKRLICLASLVFLRTSSPCFFSMLVIGSPVDRRGNIATS